MKNKKGFTLIELLITFIIMFMITGIAIVSVRKVNESKKEEAWETVKKQLETAGSEYFRSNEYFLNDQLSEGECGAVSVGTLVNEDYLNVVSNPITGETIDNCALVKVCKKGNGYIYGYLDSDEVDSSIANWNDRTCILEEPIAYNEIRTTTADSIPETTLSPEEEEEEVEGPTPTPIPTSAVTPNATPAEDNTKPTLSIATKIKTSSTNLDSKSNLSGLSNYSNSTWINKWVFVKVSATFGTRGGTVTCTDSRKKGSNYTDFSTYRNVNTEGTTTISCKATGRNGKSASSSVTIKLDHTNPTFSVGLYKKKNSTDISSSSGLSTYSNNQWFSGYVFTKAYNASDKLSGVKSYQFTTTGATTNSTLANGSYRNIDAEGTSTIFYRVCDNAGNCGKSSTYTIKLDRTGPTIELTKKLAQTTCSGTAAITSAYKVTDNLSGVVSVKDYYGTSNSCDWSYGLNRYNSSATKDFSHTHTWGKKCTSKGNYASGSFSSYKIKIRAVDAAGNPNGVYFTTSNNVGNKNSNDGNCADN